MECFRHFWARHISPLRMTVLFTVVTAYLSQSLFEQGNCINVVGLRCEIERLYLLEFVAMFTQMLSITGEARRVTAHINQFRNIECDKCFHRFPTQTTTRRVNHGSMVTFICFN